MYLCTYVHRIAVKYALGIIVSAHLQASPVRRRRLLICWLKAFTLFAFLFDVFTYTRAHMHAHILLEI